MKGKLISLLVAAFGCVLFLHPVADDSAMSRKSYAEFDRLQQLANIKGNVRVIVKLEVPGIKELTAASNRYTTVLPGKQDEWEGALADIDLKDAITRTTDTVLYNLGRTGYVLNHTYSSIPYLALEVSPEALAILESLPEVLAIEEDKPVKLSLPSKEDRLQIAKDGTIIPGRTGKSRLVDTIPLIGADDAWSMGYTGAGWYVAVLDTGLRKTHQFFTGKTVVEACYALGEDGAGPAGDCPNGLVSMIGAGAAVHYTSTYQGYDHGTHVAGIAVGNYPSSTPPAPDYGVAKNANIIAVKIFSKFSAASCGGSPCVMSWNSDSAAGLDYVYSIRGSYSIAAVNMSLGGGLYSAFCDSDSRKAAIDNLRSAGIAAAIATGNDGECGYVSAPACISTSVSVGASTDSDAEAGFNNWDETLQRLFAPGYEVQSATGASNSSYEYWSGTSMATPHVAGAWALLKQAKPTGSVTDLLAALRSTGVGVTSTCDGHTTPIPRIQVDAAISAFTGSITVTAPNGGECWKIGSTQNITWSSSGVSGNLKITLFKDGSLIGVIADNVNYALGTYAWTVGSYAGGTAVPGTGYTVKIKEKTTTVADQSNTAFTLSQLTVTAPNGGENWARLTTENITWNAANVCGNLKITLWKDGVLVGVIADNVNPALGIYAWSVGSYTGGTAAVGTGYKIKLKSRTSVTTDDSDASFNIITGVPGTITVTTPNGGESWTKGSAKNITWGSTGGVGNVKITLWQSGVKIGNIVSSTPNTGSYAWTAGNYEGGAASAGTGYTVKIQEISTGVVDSSDASFEITEPSTAWTIMVYLDGDNNLEGMGISDFMEMSSVGSTADVNIVVQFDRINGYDSSNGDWTSCKRFYVTAGMTPTAANALADLGEVNMGDPATLVGFVNWAKSNYPAQKYALVMWNHGGGWRKSKEALWRDRHDDKKHDLIFKAVCWDDTDGSDCLYMSEVKSALSSTGGAQLIGFDACLMGMMEVAYEIKAYGQVMVGSEETEPGEGWPYETIMSDLTTNPSWTASQLGSAIVDRYYASYGNDETQAAIDLAQINTLAGTISTFAQTMIDNWDADEDAVKSAAQSVIDGINNVVINEKHGSSWPGAHGLAIYFPRTVDYFDPGYNSAIIDFPANTVWEEFLDEFYTSMGGSWIASRRDVAQEFTYDEHTDLYNFCELLQLEQEDYYTETQITNAYTGGGTAQGFQADDWYITRTLPFDFYYFGEKFSAGSSIYISSNGYIDFDPASNHSDYDNTGSRLAANKRIAPIWKDLITNGSAQTGEDVYITQTADYLKIRWRAETWGDNETVNVEAVLFKDNRIQFNYGSGNAFSGAPTIGVSKGDSINYYPSVYNGVMTLTNVQSDLFTPTAGTIRLFIPNGGENWTIGAYQDITWDTEGFVGPVKITLYKNGVLQGIIADDVDASKGSYTWTVGSHSGGTAPAGADYKVKIKDKSTTTSDDSDSAFTLL